MSQFCKNAIAAAALCSVVGMTGAEAQPLSTPQNYGVKTMSFDLWCQQTQRYSADRCKQRRPEDVKAFEDYRAVVERYELQYLQQIQRDQDTRSFTTRDPSQAIFDRNQGGPLPLGR